MKPTKILRFLLALALIVALFFIVEPENVVAALAEIQARYIVYLLLWSVVLVWLSCLKWRLFIQSSGHKVGILHLMRLYVVGYFFNLFMPSYVGGDVARSYQLGKKLGSQKDAFMSTFLERFTGLLAMSMLGVGSVLLGSEVAAGVELAIMFVGAGTLVLAYACFSARFGNFCFSLAVKIISLAGLKKIAVKIEGLLEKIAKAMEHARNNPVLLTKALLLSFAFHSATVVNTFIVAKAVGWHQVEFGGLFVVVPLVLLVGMVPLTPSGLGITEGAFLFFLQRIGATQAQGFGVGLVLRAKVVVVALVGGLLFLGLREKKDSSMELSPESQ